MRLREKSNPKTSILVHRVIYKEGALWGNKGGRGSIHSQIAIYREGGNNLVERGRVWRGQIIHKLRFTGKGAIIECGGRGGGGGVEGGKSYMKCNPYSHYKPLKEICLKGFKLFLPSAFLLF